jgi:radical SAM superfamily enzyme YgiQ (UPF0313 family)
VKICKKLGIKTHATYIFGLPGENRERANKTIDFALSLGTDTAQFSIATPYPGTRFYDMAKQNKWLLTDDWESFGSSVVIQYPDYTSEDIREMHQLALARWHRHVVFSKPSTVWHHINTAYRMGGFRNVADAVLEGFRLLIRGMKWR